MVENNDDSRDFSNNNRHNGALRFSNKSKQIHNIGRNRIQNKYLTQYDELLSGTLINLYFDERHTIPIQNLFNMHILQDNLRLFTPKNLTRQQLLNLINIMNVYGPYRVDYTIYADCIVPASLSTSEKFRLASYI
jgi:hypothetical protein